MFVCLCVNFSFCQRYLRNYSTLDFEIWYKCLVCLVVLCNRELASFCLSFPLLIHFSFSPIKTSVTEYTAPMRARVFKFCIYLQRGQVYYGKENQDALIKFYLLFPFFHLTLQYSTYFFPSFTSIQYILFSISHFNAVHREFCVKDFSGTTAPRLQMLGMTCCIV